MRKGARNYLPLSKHEWHIWKPRPGQPAWHVLQMSVSAWFGRNLDHGGAGGGGAQEVGGARVGVLTQPGLEGADPGQRSSNLKNGTKYKIIIIIIIIIICLAKKCLFA